MFESCILFNVFANDLEQECTLIRSADDLKVGGVGLRAGSPSGRTEMGWRDGPK